MILFKDLILRMSKVKNIPSSLINIFLLINWKKKNIFHIFKHSILEEEFITEHDKEILIDLYISVKKLMNKLNSIARLYKFKKSVNYDIDTDLHLNPLEDLPTHEKVIILENNTLYNFKLRDLISCWKLALLNSQGLFSKPIQLKNPYTNLPFKEHNLYNIYFKCLDMYVNLPMCITVFFKCTMSLRKYQLLYYTTLKEVAIINFMNSNHYYELFEQVLNLLHDNRKAVDYLTFTNYCSISIRTKAVKVFKPMLMNYLLSKYSCNPIIKDQKLNTLKRQIQKFVEENPDLGFERGFDVMRYVPIAERPSRTNPPPPPTTLVNQLRQRRNNLRRRISRTSFNNSYSDSDDDSSDLDVVENASQPINLVTPSPINIIIPPPPPPPPTVILPRPTQPPPPPPPREVINTNTNPFVTQNQLPRTPVNNINISSRNNISSLNNNLQLNINRPSRRFGMNF